MESESTLNSLIDLAESVGITIRRAPAAEGSSDHPGGAMVRLRGREMLFLDPTASVEDQISVLGAALRGRDEIENSYLRPEIRELINGGTTE
ncbi:MAG: hypothetical protein SVT52_05355 [Planctomycetota bacterium]|nr:hypothetical protein [Planctomycetota bacterium]